MNRTIKGTFIALIATSAVAAGVPAFAGDSETVATLSCVPVAGAGPAAVAGCLTETHTANKIAQCLGITDGSCFGPNNEIKKLERSVKKEIRRLRKKLHL